MRPTIIGGGKAEPAPEAAATLPGPTVMAVTRQPEVRAVPEKVSSLPGTARAPLSMSGTELKARFPQADDAVMDALQRELVRHMPDSMDALACEQVGLTQQQAWALLLDRTLAVTAHPSVRTGQRHVVRLRELLGEVLAQFQERGWGWLRLGAASKRVKQAQLEAQELKLLLARTHDELTTVRQTLQGVLDEMHLMHIEVMATVLLLDLLGPKVSASAQHSLLERGLSLTKTSHQVLQQTHHSQQVAADLSLLSRTLHDAVWVQLPAWQATLAALPEGDWSDTQRYVVRDQTESFLHLLN